MANTKTTENEVINAEELQAEEVQSTEIVEAVAKEDIAKFSPSMFENPAENIVSTISGEDRKARIALYNAVSNSEHSLSDHKGEILEVTDYVAHAVTLNDEQTGEDIQAMRIVLVTKDGTGYHSVSGGVAQSLQRIIGLVGKGPWTDEPLKMVCKEIKTRKGFKTLSLVLMG
ncbi:hypothetical protein ABEX84_21400 [Bacillus subtilis]|uniref:hypothetical protein n=1 Tax=Bacillus subtilis TaxID=1423 RepID=UPI002DBC0EE1|nr:hypothetical protein [Bacillus subtilis]MEC3696422.1 hypothetical protein [Bacillus subtilis]